MPTVCPVCENEQSEEHKFCPDCGCNLMEVNSVRVTVKPDGGGESVASSLKNKVQKVGQKAQKGLSNVSEAVSDRARMVSRRSSNIVVQDKVTEAMGNLVNMMINVSKDVTKQIPSEMVSSIDLEAEVNFVAFTIGVNIDLAELSKSKEVK